MFACLAVFRDRGFSGCFNLQYMQGEITQLSLCRKHPSHAAGGIHNKLLTTKSSSAQMDVQDACCSPSQNQSRGIGTAEGNEQKMTQVGQVTLKKSLFLSCCSLANISPFQHGAVAQEGVSCGSAGCAPALHWGSEIDLRFTLKFIGRGSNQKFSQLSKAQTQVSLSSYMLAMSLERNVCHCKLAIYLNTPRKAVLKFKAGSKLRGRKIHF